MSQSLTCALLYAKKGIPVFPKYAGTKIPATKNGVHDATTNETIIKEWFNSDYNVAIATGPLSQIVIIDVDVNKGKDGLKSLRELEKKYGKLDTPFVQTTGSGGKQYIFRYVAPVGTVNNFMGYEGIDIRGKGASATLPPSLHENGKYYEWDGKPLWEIENIKEIPVCPEFVVAYFKEREEQKQERIKHRQENPKETSIEEIEVLLSKLSSFRYDDRDSWLHVGMAVHEGTNGSEEGLALWDSWSSQSSKWKPNECRAKWDGFYEGGGISLGTLVHMVKEDNPKAQAKTDESPDNVKGTLAQSAEESDVDLIAYEPSTDVNYAEMFCGLYCGKIKYNVDRDKWYIWNGTFWELDKKANILNLAKAAAAAYEKQALAIMDDKRRIDKLKTASMIKKLKQINNMLAFVKAHPGIATVNSEWDANDFFMGCRNGVIDLHSGEFVDGQPDYLISKVAHVDYDPSAKAPRWLQFLNEVFEGKQDVIKFVQKSVGYTLTGSMREQCFFILIGTGRNGKSVFLKTIIKLLGDYAEISKFSVFERKHNEGTTLGIAKLSGCRITTATEANQGSAGFNEALIKNLSGGDKVTDKFLYKEEFDYEPKFKIWLGVNHAPRVRDDSDGFWRRLRMINFPVKFDDTNDDKELDLKLMEELPGILNWAIEGCLLWQKEGLKVPASVALAVNEYKDSNDRLAPFISDYVVNEPNGCVYADDIWKAYMGWTKEMGLKLYQVVDSTTFHNQLARRYGKFEVEGRKAYHNIRLIKEVQNHDPYAFSVDLKKEIKL